MSNQARYLTHLPNPPDPTREPADPTLVTVGGGSLILKSESGGSVDGLKHGKLTSTDPTGKHTRKAFSVDWSSSPVWFCLICRDPARYCRYLAWSLWSRWDLPRSLQVRPKLVEIIQALFEIRSDPAKISGFWQKSGTILTIRVRPETDRKILTSDHPNHYRRRVGGGSMFRRPEVIGSVPGWAQTRPGPTRGQLDPSNLYWITTLKTNFLSPLVFKFVSIYVNTITSAKVLVTT